MATQITDMIKKAYTAFNDRNIDKALSTMQQTYNTLKPEKVVI
jgi:hypothetical protein